MNRLDIKKRAQILSCLVEGNSLRATSRIIGVSINTVTKLLCEVGEACSAYQNKTLRNISSKRIQCDEIWSFCHAKEKNLTEDKKGILGYGDVWTWTAIDADSKLIVSYFVGTRDGESAKEFISDLASRLNNKVQLTTDGHKSYLEAIEESFGADIDYAMLIKHYGDNTEARNEKRYSPAKCIGTSHDVITGKPDADYVSTSFAERQNLTMRMSMRRFTRLTNAFSKKLDNHIFSVSLYFMYYNFARIHKSLRVTPAMEAGVTEHLWSLEEIIEMSDTYHKDKCPVVSIKKTKKTKEPSTKAPSIKHYRRSK